MTVAFPVKDWEDVEVVVSAYRAYIVEHFPELISHFDSKASKLWADRESIKFPTEERC